MTAAPFSVNDARVVPASVGGLLTAVTEIVEVAVAVLMVVPLLSVTVQVTVRVGSDPKSVGLTLVDENATVSSTD